MERQVVCMGCGRRGGFPAIDYHVSSCDAALALEPNDRIDLDDSDAQPAGSGRQIIGGSYGQRVSGDNRTTAVPARPEPAAADSPAVAAVYGQVLEGRAGSSGEPDRRTDAADRAERIRQGMDDLAGLMRLAVEREDHLALGYPSWAAYIEGEFGESRMSARRELVALLRVEGKSTRQIAEQTGLTQSAVQRSLPATESVRDSVAGVRGRDGKVRAARQSDTVRAARAARRAAERDTQPAKAEAPEAGGLPVASRRRGDVYSFLCRDLRMRLRKLLQSLAGEGVESYPETRAFGQAARAISDVLGELMKLTGQDGEPVAPVDPDTWIGNPAPPAPLLYDHFGGGLPPLAPSPECEPASMLRPVPEAEPDPAATADTWHSPENEQSALWDPFDDNFSYPIDPGASGTR